MIWYDSVSQFDHCTTRLLERLKYKLVACVNINLVIVNCDFHMVVTVVKIESRSFSSAEIQHFRTENTRSDYN
jgi:hypothetical protein